MKAKIILTVLAMPLLFVAGYSWRDIRGTGESSTVTTFLGRGEKDYGQLFDTAFAKISSDYSKPVDATKLKYAAVEGMMASLGDPHTVFLEPKANEEFSMETRANFVGIGARLGTDPAGAKVEIVFDNSPASRSGLKPGDIITAVDGKSVGGMQTTDIVSRIRGKADTVVKLTVIRKGAAEPFVLSPRRATIVTPTAEGNMIPGTGVGRIFISQVSEPTAEQFDRELDKLEKQNLKGLVIDLRGNPGGLLEVTVDMLSRFQENKVVVRMKGRDGEKASYTNSMRLRKFNYPIVCLVNEDTASAAEIFAGCLRDYGMATIVGEHTYGKASVQNITPLRDRSGAKITIARYYLPTTPDISRKMDEYGAYKSGGLKPDVPAEIDPDSDAVFGDIKTDTQLKKAVDVVLSKTSK